MTLIKLLLLTCTSLLISTVAGSKTVDDGTFTTEYELSCGTSSISQRTAKRRCKYLDEGYHLASPATKAANDVLAMMAASHPGQYVWTSGGLVDGKLAWTEGRYKGQEICSTSYCNWQESPASCGSSDGEKHFVLNASSGKWTNISDTNCFSTLCYACERSRCSIAADCHAPGTKSVSGEYFPDCSCTCKENYSGTRCENGPSVEETTTTETDTATTETDTATTETSVTEKKMSRELSSNGDVSARRNSETAERNQRGLCNFLGCYDDVYYLLAFSPVALLVATDDGYSGIIYSDIVIIGIVTIIHCIVVVIYKVCASDTTFVAACSRMMFPNISLYFVFALLPGIAVSAGELTAVGKPLGIIALIITVLVVVFAFLFPFLYLSRGLVTATRSMDSEGTCKALLFPTTVIVPEKGARMYGALVGRYRFCQPFWTILPTLSSVLILIGGLATSQRGLALYVVFGIIHVALMVVVLVLRPHRCLAIDVLFAAALLPVTILAFVRAAQNSDSESGDGVATFATVLLVLMLIVTIIRLVAALLLPLVSSCLGADNYFLLKPIWVWNSKCGESLTLTMPVPEATSDNNDKGKEHDDDFLSSPSLPDENDKNSQSSAVPVMESSLSTIAAPVANNPLNASFNSQEKPTKDNVEVQFTE